MSNSVEQAVRTWIITQHDQEIEYITKEIEKGSTSLLNLVKSLKDYLTSEEDGLRVKGVTLLSDVVKRLPDISINAQSTKVLCAFFISKLDTVDEVIPALKGLQRLSTMSTFSEQDCKDTVQGLFTLNMKAHVQSTRHIVFSIIDTLMAQHRSTLLSLGSPFVKGYIGLAEGEKDPRNLRIAFALDRVILLEFDISDYVEQLYDITFCYFPITFKAPANDPYGVTGEDLVIALRECLSASPLLGPLGMPLFIEKLNAGTPSTKKDTMKTIAICIPVYGQAVAQQFASKLWDGLKIEIFQPTDTEVQEGALEVMRVLVQTCHPDGTLLDGIGQTIIRMCSEVLKEPSTTRGQAAIKVVTSLISSSETTAKSVIQELIPRLLESYDNSNEVTTKPSILIALSNILEAKREANWVLSEGSDDPIVTYKDGLLSRLISALHTPEMAVSSLQTLHQLVQLRLLSNQEVEYVAHNLTDSLIKSRTSDDDLTAEVLAVLVTLSAISPKLVEDITLQALFALLPDDPPQRGDVDTQALCIHALAALEILCHHPDLFACLVIRLLTRIELLMGGQDTGSISSTNWEASIAYAHAMLITIYTTLEKKVERKDSDVSKYVERFVPRLYYLFFHANLVSETPIPLGESRLLIDDASRIIALIVASLPHERQKAWTNAVFDAFFGDKLSTIAFVHQPLPEQARFNPLEISDIKPSSRDRLIPLFTSALVGLYPETPIPVPDLNEWLKKVMYTALVDEPDKRVAMSALAASILNKHVDECTAFIQNHLDTFWTTFIADTTVSTEKRAFALGVWCSALQALTVRNHPASIPLVKRLFGIFGDATLSLEAAKSLGQLPNLSGSVLNKRYHATIRLLYAQRLFGFVAPEIKAAYTPVMDANISRAYLTAVSTLIPSIPKGSYSQAIDLLFPLLLRGLELDDPGLRANVVDSFVAIVESDSELKGMETITTHMGTLVAVMLRSTQTQGRSQAVVRLKSAALRFLAALPSRLKQEDAQPFKAQVLRELRNALDDSSRLVRREAVVARSKWYKTNS